MFVLLKWSLILGLSYIHSPHFNCCMKEQVSRELRGQLSKQSDHLNAMHAMRREFIRLESCEKVRRALRSKVRTHANIRYLSGEDVFYKREDETKWLGPARVIGQDGSKILLKIPTVNQSINQSIIYSR